MKISHLKTAVALSVLLVVLLAGCKSEQSAEMAPTHPTDEEILSQGQEIAAKTFAALGSSLKAALERGGVAEAVQYCNLEALPITDSLSRSYNVTIKRTGTKLRNEKNAPDEMESGQLASYASLKAEGKELKPTVATADNGQKIFYAPIMLNEFCLQCHGKVGEDIKTADYEIIKNLYPGDRATDFSAGDLRGMWSIAFSPLTVE